MGGTSMAMQRWAKEPAFYRDRPIVQGDILDIGPGQDPLARFAPMFPQARHWVSLDHNPMDGYSTERIEGDATEGAELLAPRQFDLVFSSHSLEHLDDPSGALRIWWRLVKPGGHLVVIVPSWVHYERCIWPPSKNQDHRTAWVLYLPPEARPLPFIRGLVNEVGNLGGIILRTITLDAGFKHGEEDQTRDGSCESGIEIVAQKPETV